jgi:hypothetical protein
VGAVPGLVLALLTALVGTLTALGGLLLWAVAWLDEPQDWELPALLVPVGLVCAGATWLCCRRLLRLRR